jgi:hypothetical protein
MPWGGYMMKRGSIILLSILAISLLGCGKSSSPVIDVITSNTELGEVQYWTIYDNNKAEKAEEFQPVNIKVLNVPDNDFSSEINGNKISVIVNEYEIEDEYGSSYEADGNLRRIIDDVAENADHDIFGVKILNVDGNIFVFEKHNVNWQLPCVLYQYFPDTRELSKLYQWDGVELVGLGNIRIAD